MAPFAHEFRLLVLLVAAPSLHAEQVARELTLCDGKPCVAGVPVEAGKVGVEAGNSKEEKKNEIGDWRR